MRVRLSTNSRAPHTHAHAHSHILQIHFDLKLDQLFIGLLAHIQYENSARIPTNTHKKKPSNVHRHNYQQQDISAHTNTLGPIASCVTFHIHHHPGAPGRRRPFPTEVAQVKPINSPHGRNQISQSERAQLLRQMCIFQPSTMLRRVHAANEIN